MVEITRYVDWNFFCGYILGTAVMAVVVSLMDRGRWRRMQDDLTTREARLRRGIQQLIDLLETVHHPESHYQPEEMLLALFRHFRDTKDEESFMLAQQIGARLLDKAHPLREPFKKGKTK